MRPGVQGAHARVPDPAKQNLAICQYDRLRSPFAFEKAQKFGRDNSSSFGLLSNEKRLNKLAVASKKALLLHDFAVSFLD